MDKLRTAIVFLIGMVTFLSLSYTAFNFIPPEDAHGQAAPVWFPDNVAGEDVVRIVDTTWNVLVDALAYTSTVCLTVDTNGIFGTTTCAGGAGGGGTTTVQVDGTEQGVADVFDFNGTDFTLVESPTNDFDISIASGITRDTELSSYFALSDWYSTTSAPQLTTLANLSITESQISDLGAYITGVAWGDITGTLSNQTDLQNALDAKLSLSAWYATTTSDIAEGTNLYYTTNRFAGDLAGTTTDALSEGVTNRYYSTNLFASDLAGTTTTALTEGTNLYYTDARVATYINGSSSIPNISCATDQILKWSGGWACATDVSGGGGGGSGLWATTTNNQVVYPVDTNDIVVIGSNATTTTGNIFEVVGSSLFDNFSALLGTTTEFYAGTRLGLNNDYIQNWEEVNATYDAYVTVCATNDCDYVTDGTADEIQIEQALTAVGSYGTVHLKNGTYTVSSPITIANDGVTLMGEGKGTEITLANSVNDFAIEVDDTALLRDITVKSLQVDGNRAGNTDGGCIVASSTITSLFTELWLHHCADQAIKFASAANGDYGHNNIFSDSQIDNGGKIGVEFQANDENKVMGNTIDQVDDYHIYDRAGLQTIVGNSMTAVDKTTAIGVHVEFASRTQIVGNVFDGIGRHAIDLQGGGNQSNVIANNQFLNSGKESAGTYSDIYLDNSDYNAITGNTAIGPWHEFFIEENSFSPSENNVVANNTSRDHVSGQMYSLQTYDTNNQYLHNIGTTTPGVSQRFIQYDANRNQWIWNNTASSTYEFAFIGQSTTTFDVNGVDSGTFTAASTTGTSTMVNLSISSGLLFNSVYGDTWADFCVSITGSADLCDGSDDGGGGSSPWTDAGTYVYTTNDEYIQVPNVQATSTWGTATSTFTHALQVGTDPMGAHNLAHFDCGDGTYSSSLSNGGCVHIDNTNNGRPALKIYTDQGTEVNNEGILSIVIDNVAHDQGAIYVRSDGTDGGDYAFRAQGATPDIELYDTDYGSEAYGGFELDVGPFSGTTTAGASRWNFRNNANTSYSTGVQLGKNPIFDMAVLTFDHDNVTAAFGYGDPDVVTPRMGQLQINADNNNGTESIDTELLDASLSLNTAGGGCNATQKYQPGLVWGTYDSSLAAPEWIAGIFGTCEEQYDTNNDAASALEFWTGRVDGGDPQLTAILDEVGDFSVTRDQTATTTISSATSTFANGITATCFSTDGTNCITGAGGGITTLNTQTGATQTFSDVDDTNVTLAISSGSNDHQFTIGWTGELADARVADNITASNYLALSAWFATTSAPQLTTLANLTITESQISDLTHYTTNDFAGDLAGTTTDALSEGSTNLYFTNTRADDRVDAVIIASSSVPNISCSTGEILEWSAGGAWVCAADETGGAPAWGSITGTLSNQTDLQNALDAKLDLSAWYATTTTDIGEGTNLYYTDARVATYINGSSTIWNDNTEASLESFLTDVTDVFTNNDGALTDDDITNDSIESLNDVGSFTQAAGDLLVWNGSLWTNVASTSLISLTDVTDVTLSGCTNGEVLEYSGGIFNCATDDTGGAGVWTDQGTYLDPTNGEGIIVRASSTVAADFNAFNSTTTALYTTTLGLNSEYFTDLTGTGLTNTGGALTLVTSGDWTGTFDGQEGSYYLANSFSTTSANFWETQQTARTADDLTDDTIQTLSNVDTTGVAASNILMWNGTNWVDQATTSFIMADEIDTESELEGLLGDVTNVFTNNDGALTDDDITNDSIESLSDVASFTQAAGDLLVWNGSLWTNVASTSLISLTDVTDVTLSGCTNGEVLEYNGGVFNCATDDTGGGGGGFAWTTGTNYGVTENATSTLIGFKAGLTASSTSYFQNDVNFAQAGWGNATTTILGALQVGTEPMDAHNLVHFDCGDATYSSSLSNGGCFHIENTGNGRPAMKIYTNEGTQVNNEGLLGIVIDNAAHDQGAIYVRSDGTDGGDYAFKAEGATPDIELFDTDYVTENWGAFEIDVGPSVGSTTLGSMRFNFRNNANNSFTAGVYLTKSSIYDMGIFGSDPDAITWAPGYNDPNVIDPALGQVQIGTDNNNGTESIDAELLSHSVNLMTGPGGCNATQTYAPGLMWGTYDSSLTSGKWLAGFFGTCEETMAADTDSASAIEVWAGANDDSNPHKIAKFWGNQDDVLELYNTTNSGTTTVGAGTTNHITYNDGTERLVAEAEQVLISGTFSSTSVAFIDSGTIPFSKNLGSAIEITRFECFVVGGTSKVMNLTDGTNDTETITCGTTATSDSDVATNDTFTANELRYVEFGATTGTVDYVSFTAYGYVNI